MEAVDGASVQLHHNVKVQQARRFGFRAGSMRTQGYEQIDIYTQGGFVLDETGSKTYANGLPSQRRRSKPITRPSCWVWPFTLEP